MTNPRKHKHAEAFSLMWYSCKCGHRERIWNARDGVTPFSLDCPSCNGWASLSHKEMRLDEYKPFHQPKLGQRFWVTLTPERAAELTQERMDRAAAVGEVYGEDARQRIEADIYGNGTQPDLRVWGYRLIPTEG